MSKGTTAVSRPVLTALTYIKDADGCDNLRWRLARVTLEKPMHRFNLTRAILLLAALMLSPTCLAQSALDGDAGASVIIARLASEAELGDDRFARRPVRASRMVGRFYASVGHTPVWAGAGFAQARQAIDVLDRAEEHGLIRADYQLDPPPPMGATPTAEQLARFDVKLTLTLLQFLADLHFGRITPEFTRLPDDLAPSQFDPAAHLLLALRDGRLPEAIAEAQPRIPLYARVKDTLAQYRQLEQDHRNWSPLAPLAPGARLRPGVHDPALAQLAERLVALGDMPGATGEHPAAPEPAQLAAGVRNFQLRHGLEENGVANAATVAAVSVPLSQRVVQLELTLERLRWIPPLPPGPVVVVNVPAFRLWAFDTATVHDPLEMRVIVGTAARTPTPLFIGQMRYLEFNPYWNVPRSIARGEIIPKLMRDPAYLRKNDMEIVSINGQPMPPDAKRQLAALRAGSARVRQQPGARNVLGAVKFAMPNPMNIYLHSTSAKELFSKTRRDLSHGCIRVERPAELAQFVLADEITWNRESVLAAMKPGASKTVRLARPVPVILSYATAVTDRSGRALFAADIYRRDQKLAESLMLR